MKKIFTLIALIAISYAGMAQWLPQASGFTTPSRGIGFMDAVNESVVWAAAYDGTAPDNANQEFTRTVNGGDLWTPGVVTGAEGTRISMIDGLNADTAYVAMFVVDDLANQGVYVTRDGGVTWEEQTTAAYSNSSSFLNVVHFFDANNGVTQGDPINGEFEIYTTTDGGNNWTLLPGDAIPNPLSNEWGVVGYTSAVGDTIWFGTNKGRVYRSTDKGYTWDVSTASLGATYIDVEFANGMYGLAQDKGSSTTGALSETFDGGVTWADVTSVGPTLTADIVYVPGTDATFIATGSDVNTPGASGIAYSYDGGHTWDYFLDTDGFQFLATDFVSPTSGWVGAFNQTATEGGMYVFNGDLTSSTNDLPAVENLMVYPNPVSGMLNVRSDSRINSIQVINLSGQLVLESVVNGNAAMVNTSNLTKGLYMLNVISDNGIDTRKISIN